LSGPGTDSHRPFPGAGPSVRDPAEWALPPCVVCRVRSFSRRSHAWRDDDDPTRGNRANGPVRRAVLYVRRRGRLEYANPARWLANLYGSRRAYRPSRRQKYGPGAPTEHSQLVVKPTALLRTILFSAKAVGGALAGPVGNAAQDQCGAGRSQAHL